MEDDGYRRCPGCNGTGRCPGSYTNNSRRIGDDLLECRVCDKRFDPDDCRHRRLPLHNCKVCSGRGKISRFKHIRP
jgi:hypothetical protein